MDLWNLGYKVLTAQGLKNKKFGTHGCVHFLTSCQIYIILWLLLESPGCSTD